MSHQTADVPSRHSGFQLYGIFENARLEAELRYLFPRSKEFIRNGYTCARMYKARLNARAAVQHAAYYSYVVPVAPAATVLRSDAASEQ